MGKTITQKILERHLVSGELAAGSEIGIRIDQTLTQDATGTMAYLQFESMGVPRVRTELSVSYIDHNTVQIGFENADDHKYLQSAARRYGIHFSRPGNGICHQVHLERFGKPGKTLIGSDSHTPTGGGLGMLAIGAGGLDVALAMAGEPFYFICPRVIRVNLTGRLPAWSSAKDVILSVLAVLTTRGNVDCVLEYSGEGARTLSVPERATITNMGAECGVTTSIFPSDELTRKFLAAQGRGQDWELLLADEDALYDRELEINLSEVAPMAAKPHSPDNTGLIRDLAGTAVDQVCIGSCTNSSYKDLATVAEILKGRTVHPDVSLVITPGSRQVLLNLADAGRLGTLIAAGARITESCCGFCIGNSQSPPSSGVSLRTSNRNFFGRSGTKDAMVYLVSPETAAAAALTGSITDPRTLGTLGIKYPEITEPELYRTDDSLIMPPEADESARNGTVIRRGPNIGSPPVCLPLPEKIDGEAAIKVGDNITTDHIIPAGDRMKYRSNIDRYSDFVFEIVDPGFAARARKIKEGRKQGIIVGGLSYGQGSSREHAAICPMHLGIRAVIAKSFERIHATNLVNFGIAPLVFADEGDYDGISAGDRLEIPQIRSLIKKGEPLTVMNATRGSQFKVKYNLSDRQKEILLAGGAINTVQTKGEK
jgi:aconitate hydratase